MMYGGKIGLGGASHVGLPSSLDGIKMDGGHVHFLLPWPYPRGCMSHI